MRVLAALLACAVMACASSGSDAAERREDTTGRRDSVAGVAAASLTEGGVVGLLLSVNTADSALGALGAQRGSTSEVKEFARMILREHMALRREVSQAATQLGITPETPRTAPDDAPAVMRSNLLGQPAGPVWDRAYVQYAVAMHEAAMENTARALAATKRPEIRQLIERSVPILDKHLTKARSLEKRLSGAPATPPGGRR
jgi:putative membrane protein